MASQEGTAVRRGYLTLHRNPGGRVRGFKKKDGREEGREEGREGGRERGKEGDWYVETILPYQT